MARGTRICVTTLATRTRKAGDPVVLWSPAPRCFPAGSFRWGAFSRGSYQQCLSAVKRTQRARGPRSDRARLMRCTRSPRNVLVSPPWQKYSPRTERNRYDLERKTKRRLERAAGGVSIAFCRARRFSLWSRLRRLLRRWRRRVSDSPAETFSWRLALEAVRLECVEEATAQDSGERSVALSVAVAECPGAEGVFANPSSRGVTHAPPLDCAVRGASATRLDG